MPVVFCVKQKRPSGTEIFQSMSENLYKVSNAIDVTGKNVMAANKNNIVKNVNFLWNIFTKTPPKAHKINNLYDITVLYKKQWN